VQETLTYIFSFSALIKKSSARFDALPFMCYPCNWTEQLVTSNSGFEFAMCEQEITYHDVIPKTLAVRMHMK